MKKSKFTDSQIVFSLRQAEEGTAIEEACRKTGMTAMGQQRKSSVGLGMSGVGGGAEVDFGPPGSYPIHAATGVRAVESRVGVPTSFWEYTAPSEGEIARPGANGPRELASLDTTTPAACAAVARCSGVKSGSGCDFILNIGLPLGVSKLARFRPRPRRPGRQPRRMPQSRPDAA